MAVIFVFAVENELDREAVCVAVGEGWGEGVEGEVYAEVFTVGGGDVDGFGRDSG